MSTTTRFLVLAGLLVAVVAIAVLLAQPSATNTNGGAANTPTATTNTTTVTNLNSSANASANTNVSATTNSTADTTAATPATNAANVNETVVASGTTVTVLGTGFLPKSLTIKAGQTVTWINEAGTEVYIAPDIHPSHKKYAGTWDDTGAGNIQNGESYSFTFTKAGTYTYHDHLSSSLIGTVIVE